MTAIYDCNAVTLKGEEISLERFRGQVLLIVNTASQCGFRSQLRELETLFRDYSPQGFYVLGFPCSQFVGQEVCDLNALMVFYELSYNVTFPMFAKISVNGRDTHPLYKILKQQQPGFLGSESIKWNFTKFLVNRSGNVVARYFSTRQPAKIRPDIEKLLALKV